MTKLAMNLQYERTIAIHLPIYFEREQLRAQKLVHLEIYNILSMIVLQELDLIVIAMRLDAGGGNSITKQCTLIHTLPYFLNCLLGSSLWIKAEITLFEHYL
jgi:hypothetical protein